MENLESIIVEGKTVKEAIKKALQQLRLPLKKVNIEIITEEQKGLFGMPGAKMAKVRASIIKSAKTT